MSRAVHRGLLQPRLIEIGCLFILAANVWFVSAGMRACSAAPPVAAAPAGVLGITSMASWKNTYGAFRNEFFGRGLPPASTVKSGWFVTAVGPVHAEGVEEGDIITKIDGIELEDDDSEKRAKQGLKVGVDSVLEIMRYDGRTRTWKAKQVTTKPVDREKVVGFWAAEGARHAEETAIARQAEAEENSTIWECWRCQGQYIGKQAPIGKVCPTPGAGKRYCDFHIKR